VHLVHHDAAQHAARVQLLQRPLHVGNADEQSNECQARAEDAASVYGYIGTLREDSHGTGGQARNEDADRTMHGDY
jgi:hypothetical protein